MAGSCGCRTASTKPSTLTTSGGGFWVEEIRWLEPGADRECRLDLDSGASPSLNAPGTQLSASVTRDRTEGPC